MSGDRDPSHYRANVGLAVFSKRGHVLIGRRAGVRRDDSGHAWQMPQGGVDRGEAPHEAAIRELGEEIGVGARQVDLLEELEPWLYYDFPPALKARLSGPYVGQRQKWFAFRFNGVDSDIRLDVHTPEFDAWRWTRLDETPDLIIPFKRPVYEEVARRFARWTAPV
ncbi:MAG: RNA pyrophosphohydrolase [Alphaproteobacteria bacterium]|nr:RNA pyrophosphohydrolase [Alphaproteobacteria bacterium]